MSPVRSLRLGAVAVLLAIGPAACSAASDDNAAVPDALPRAAAQDLTVAVGEDPFLRPVVSPDVMGGQAGATGRRDLGLRTDGPQPGIFETLTRVTPTFGVAPGLAETWEEVSPTRWRFTLRSDVSFHDGSAFDAAAVVESLATRSHAHNPPRGLEPGGVTAVDELTVEVELSYPNRRLPEQLADPSTAIRAPGTEAGAGANATDTPTGTGPFRFSSYAAGRQLVVAANEDYWGGRPQLDTLTFLFGPAADASRRLATREALAVGHVPEHALARVSHRDRRVSSSPARAAYLLLNVGGSEEWGTLKDDRLRRAVALAVDRGALTQAVWPDHGEPNDTLIPAAVLDAAAGEVSAPAHDLQAARRLLDDAGWESMADGVRHRDGRPLTLTLLLAAPEELRAAAEVLGDQLADAGIALALPDVDGAPPTPFVRVNEGTFDLFLDLRAQSDANPCAFCRFFSIRPGGQLTVAGTVGAGEAADALYEEAFTAPSTESARRRAAQVMDVVVADEVVAVPLATLPHVWLLSPRVQGFEPDPLLGAQRWEQVWLTV